MARLRTKPVPPVKLDAAYTPTGRAKAICPVCWSRPSVDGRRENYDRPHSKGWSVTYEMRQIEGREIHVLKSQYPCSNKECNTIIVTRSTLANITQEQSPWIVEHRLQGADAEAYDEGITTPQGVWTGIRFQRDEPKEEKRRNVATAKPILESAAKEAEPPVQATKRGRGRPPKAKAPPPRAESKKETPEWNVEYTGPWMYVDCPVFNLAYPAGWTLDAKGRVKVRMGTAREKQVRDFFLNRGVTLQ